MSLSERESRLVLVTVLIAMLGSVGFFLKPQLDKYRDAKSRTDDLERDIQEEKRWINRRARLVAEDKDLQGELPEFDAGAEVDAYWFGVLDRVARRHALSLLRRDAEEERVAGNARELPIDFREWRGTTASLLKFLHDLQVEQSSMDVRYIRMRPKGKMQLEGRLKVYCAYTRKPKAQDERGDLNGDVAKETAND